MKKSISPFSMRGNLYGNHAQCVMVVMATKIVIFAPESQIMKWTILVYFT